MKKIIILIIAVFFLVGCNCKNEEKTTTEKKPSNDYLTMAVLYHQNAAEIKAIYYQSFNLARVLLDEDIEDNKTTKKRAVIVDIDETILDNSPYEAQCVLANICFPEKWDEWVGKGVAGSIPGAVDFLNYVVEKKAEVFYVTNRKESLRDATMKNLKEKGFPMVDNTHILMKTDSTNKEIYRNSISETHHISLLIGDNLSDFSVVFDKKTLEVRSQRTDSLKNEFGTRFIILPNAMYGDWEMAVYLNNSKLSEAVKDSMRKANLKACLTARQGF
jgi:5'-nucleotidase (lipoprotein e(P4) family)